LQGPLEIPITAHQHGQVIMVNGVRSIYRCLSKVEVVQRPAQFSPPRSACNGWI
jgi:hypothetical protein